MTSPQPQQPQQPQQYQAMPPQSPLSQMPQMAQPQLPQGDRGIDQPWYGIDFGAAIKRFFAKSVRFEGRASRGEYWWMFLFVYLINLILTILISTAGTTYIYGLGYTNSFGAVIRVISLLFSVAMFLPMSAVVARRFHDTNKPTRWVAIYVASFAVLLISNYFGQGFSAASMTFISISGILTVLLIVLMAMQTYMGPTQWDLPLKPMPQPTMPRPVVPQGMPMPQAAPAWQQPTQQPVSPQYPSAQVPSAQVPAQNPIPSENSSEPFGGQPGMQNGQ